jgi:cytochrome P450
VGSLFPLTADWIGYLTDCKDKYGRVVHFRMPWPLKPIVLITDPEHIERVYVQDAPLFRKPIVQRVAEPLLGDGLFLAEGENWKRLHRMSIPAFQPARIKAYGDDMAQCAEDLVAGWQHGAVRDIYADTTHLTVRVGARTLFGAEGGGDSERAGYHLAEAFGAFDTYLKSRFPLPLRLPTPSGIRIRRAAKQLDAISHRFIQDRRKSGEQRADLLSMLLRARDEDGSAFTERELRDVAWNIFGAGFDTTALTLAWSVFLLARHPEIAHRVRAEVAGMVGEQRVGADHIPRLTLTGNVIKEALRMFPPGWLVGRETLRDYEIGGYHIPRGTQLFIMPYLMGHDREFFPDPERFLPDRWSDGTQAHMHRHAYIPFGGGPRICIGKHFALMEATISLATMVRAAHFELAGRSPEPGRPSFGYKPSRPILIRVQRLDQPAGVGDG